MIKKIVRFGLLNESNKLVKVEIKRFILKF